MDKETRLRIFTKAALIRNFEEITARYINKGLFKFPIYLSAGQEFIAATLAEKFQNNNPLLFAQHRAHSFYLAFNGNIEKLIDELLGRKSGCANGMGGSASIQSKEINMFGHDGFIGSEIPIAVGACFASKQLTIAIMGDAAAEEDYVLSSLGWAATKKLNILFVVEDNNLSILTKKEVRRSWDISNISEAFGIKSFNIIDDPCIINDCLDCNLPLLLNIKTDRIFWHAGGGIDNYIKNDRYKIEIEKLGKDAIDIDKYSKDFLKELWEKKINES